MLKKIIVLFCMLCVVGSVWGKTNIFGDGREFWLTAGDAIIETGYGFRPLDKLSWGAELDLVRGGDSSTTYVKTDEYLAGLYLTYPMISATSLIESIGLEATISAKVSALSYLDHYDGIVTKVGAVADVPIDEHLSARMGYNMVAGTNDIKDNVVSFGIVAKW